MPYFKTENGNAENIKYDNTKSVKEAIDDIKNNQAASLVTFNNTDTGLNATNVQDAVTEVNGKLGNVITVMDTFNHLVSIIKIGRVVVFQNQSEETNITLDGYGSKFIFTLPEGYRPEQFIYLPIKSLNNTNASLVIRTDGTVSLYNTVSTSVTVERWLACAYCFIC